MAKGSEVHKPGRVNMGLVQLPFFFFFFYSVQVLISRSVHSTTIQFNLFKVLVSHSQVYGVGGVTVRI